MILLRLFLEFFRTGLFALGGGLATLPFLYDMGERLGWFSKGDIVNMLAISESTPGAIGVNMSTYVGFHIDGLIGAAIATFGLVLPSVIIVVCVAKVLEKFKENPYIQSGFYGIRPVVAGLILAAMMQVFQIAFLKEHSGIQIDFKSVIFFVILYIGNKLFEWKKGKTVHPIILIVISGCVGVLLLGA
ncbi:MAG: chromate transporter [Anaerostipes sp.]|jgi:chromate transporter|nr:chromate transporter [Anaerostipes sp.]MDD3745237.1 chromate transporter [Anaerostipes sp.]